MTSAVIERQMEEREEPTFVEFKAPGDFVSGILMGIQKCVIKGKPGVRFVLFNEEEQKAYCFLATHQLMSKLRPTDKGRYIEVTYKGEDTSVRGGGANGNAMKVFHVKVEKAPSGQPNVHGVYVTDEDIPF